MASSPHKRSYLWWLQGGVCHFCGRQCYLFSQGSLLFTCERIVPKRWKGGNALENLVGACFACNQRRGVAAEGLGRRAARAMFAIRWAERKAINKSRHLDFDRWWREAA